MTTLASNQKKPKSLPKNWPKSTEADLIARPNRIVHIGNVNDVVDDVDADDENDSDVFIRIMVMMICSYGKCYIY